MEKLKRDEKASPTSLTYESALNLSQTLNRQLMAVLESCLPHVSSEWWQDGPAVASCKAATAAYETLATANVALSSHSTILWGQTLLDNLRRLSAAAAARDNVMGDPCALLAVKAELRDANNQACIAIAQATKGLGDNKVGGAL